MAKGLAGNYGVRTETQSRAPAKRDDGGSAPVQNDYQRIGDTNTFRTPDRMMTVGIRSATEATGPPQSEQPGRGALIPTANERLSQWYQDNQSQSVTGYGPVAQIVNDSQFTPS